MVKRAQQGDDRAYLTLFQQYEAELYRTAYIYLNNREDALDAVQETAYRSFRAIGGLQEPRYFKTWLIRIAIRCATDLLRKRRHDSPLPADYADELAVTDDELEELPLALTVKDLIETLDAQEKGIILLRFYHDCTLREVAEMLDIPLGSAKTALYRALKKLRSLVKGDSLDE